MTDFTDQKEKYIIDFEGIKELIESYEQKKRSGELRRYNEETTKNNFITPLFRALGWNTENRVNRNDSVSYEENISGKRSDYGFSLNSIIKFYLEAKSLKEEEILFGTDYDKQAVNYAWLKSCSWAVLTNFETLAVYNADSGEPVWAYTLKVNEFLGENGREKLKFLSKKGFEEGLLDKWAEDNGKKPMKRPVDKQLLQDMIHFREILSKDIRKNNPNVSESDLDETVQRTLDRLVFIRNAEDRGYEPKELNANYNQWSLKESGHLIKKIRELYRYYRSVYNSGLFGRKDDDIHISDQVEISNEALVKVIQGLYSPEGAKYRYNFAVLDSDVLGRIYEQYLGNILKSTPKRAKLEESKTHRKEQGIYYTPSYIVDYIVRNTVGEYIKNHTPEEIKKVRILDPACGSGSFLIRAYKELETYWKKNSDLAQTTLDSEEFYSKKVEILKNNIFGVDLDPKAVEIAQLNLLLQISERKQKLPILQNNIKVGNSLIDDPAISEKSFKWEEGFPEIIKEGGFDIVIGNPPYGAELDTQELTYLNEKLVNDKSRDSANYFLAKSVQLLERGGILGFIVPKGISYVPSSESIRTLMINNQLIKVLDVSEAFGKDVQYEQIIVVLIKGKSQLEQLKTGYFADNKFIENESSQDALSKERILIWSNKKNIKIIQKILINSIKLNEIASTRRGLGCNRYVTSSNSDFVCFKGQNIQRYRIEGTNYVAKGNVNRDYSWLLKPKVIAQEIVGRFGKPLFGNFRNVRLKATLDLENSLTLDTVVNIFDLDQKYSLNFILGLINSKLMSWFFHIYFYNKAQITVHFGNEYVRNFPVPKEVSDSDKSKLDTLVDNVLSMNKQLNEIGHKNTLTVDKLKEELKKLDLEIDKTVYQIYGLTNDETEIIERDYSFWPIDSN